MSRKWERMVERNRKKINAYKKQPALSQAEKDRMQGIYRGRSYILPLFLIFVNVFFILMYGGEEGRTALFWVTVIMYALLTLYFFLKRPYVKVGNDSLAMRRTGREKVLQADEIEKIILLKGYVVVSIRGKKTKWVFSRLIHLFDTDALAEKLREFAAKHRIPVEQG